MRLFTVRKGDQVLSSHGSKREAKTERDRVEGSRVSLGPDHWRYHG